MIEYCKTCQYHHDTDIEDYLILSCEKCSSQYITERPLTFYPSCKKCESKMSHVEYYKIGQDIIFKTPIKHYLPKPTKS
jgi:hypothetical protein